MFERLGNTGTRLYVGHIDDYEKGRRVPPLQVVLAYARAAGVFMEALADDRISLPDQQSPASELKKVKKPSKKA
jgi:hypothetical protein